MNEGRERTSWAERSYGLLLRAYPRSYRLRFGSQMRDTFLRDHFRVWAARRSAVVPFWIVTVGQAVWFGALERTRLYRAPMNAFPHVSGFRLRGPLEIDVRYAVRLLARSPLFTLTSVLSLAIGIAFTTTIFGLADALLLRGSPGVRDPARIVEIAGTNNGRGFGTLSYPVFRHLRDHSRALASISATTMSPTPLSMSVGETSESVSCRTVSGNFFDTLGVRPALGRFFRADEDKVPDARPVVVLSQRFWRERFESDPRIVDRTLRLGNTAFTVIGIAEAGFENPTFVGTDLWVPMAMAGTVRGEPGADLLGNPASTWHMAVGRLEEGVTREAAQTELNHLLDAFKADTPSVPASHGIVVVKTGLVPAPVRTAFGAFVGVLFALTGGLLAIACSNVAGLLVARAIARRREMATRLALGASRSHLVRQMLVETLVLFVAAGLVALPLTFWLSSGLQAFLPSLPLPIRLDLTISLRALLFAAGISMLTGVLFGLAPARRALKTDLFEALQGRSPTAGPERMRLRHGLVVVQVALSLAMATTAGLLVRTLHEALRLDTGFRTADVDLVSIDTALVGATGSRAVPLVERVAERIRTIAGVEAVGHARMVPLQGSSFALGIIRVPGLDDAAAGQLGDTGWDVVSPDYFLAVGLPIVEGRAFSIEDRADRPRVAIVNQAFARVAWPGRPAVGQRFWQTTDRQDEGRPLEVVGVAKDAKYRTFGEAQQTFVYVPFAQQPQSRVELFVKRAPERSIFNDARAAIHEVEPGLPVVWAQSFAEATAVGLLPQRVASWIAGFVGGIGIVLAAFGLYGLTAFLATQRTGEIAIRMALGASSRDVRTMVLGQAAWLGVIGAVFGLALAVGLARLIQSLNLLVGVRPTDPLTFGGGALLMITVLFAASYLPARRAAATDPAVALRAP